MCIFLGSFICGLVSVNADPINYEAPSERANTIIEVRSNPSESEADKDLEAPEEQFPGEQASDAPPTEQPRWDDSSTRGVKQSPQRKVPQIIVCKKYCCFSILGCGVIVLILIATGYLTGILEH